MFSFMGGQQDRMPLILFESRDAMIQPESVMTMFIRVASVCDALEAVLPRLSPATGDAVQFLLDIIPDESRFLCFVPVRAGCVTELWAHYMYVNDCEDAATRADVADRVPVPAAWVVLPGPEASASQARRLVQSIEAFHFFAPLHELELDELANVDEQLAGTVKTLQRIRSTPTEELFGKAFALIPPATFTVAAPGLIRIDDTMSPRPQGCPRYRANSVLLPDSLFVVLHPAGSKVEVDVMFGVTDPRSRQSPVCANPL
ncbi:hypothetical protein J2W25_004605 [Variovorax boronicumulans]|uniref:Uncharacterized protein n=1 Tax=Variovorax boronicumulans TaxID=436515 RepID=A0AAW8E2Z5_9BURK|nr:hypothetical protein [Variovorax boronicumulans]MDP9880277.1 hypothetical protein [Variovorax boronicumulans]MDP9925562.1 hypothetical protein [Variovorax boronicumulans]